MRPTPTARMRALLGVAGVLSGLLTACSGSGAPSPPTDTQVRSALARHAHGVLAHDRSDFLATVGTGAAAAPFRENQQAEYDNLVGVPLASWSYTLGAPVTDTSAQAAARSTFGRSARIVRVELHYALRGADTAPVEHDLWWTFVRDGGVARAVSDTGLADAGGVSWAGPWDFGPMATVTGTTAIVFGRADQVSSLRAIAAAVDAAIPTVTSVWGTDWNRHVAVIVPPSSTALAAAVGTSSAEPASTDIAALSVSAGTDPLTARPLEQRLVVDPDTYDTLSDLGRRVTITHELTHLASAAATTEAQPRWLVEGLAEYVGNLTNTQPVRTVAAELTAQLRAGQLPATLPTDAAVDDDATAASAYEQAWLACRLIAGRAGAAGLVRFYRLVGASPDSSDDAVAAGLQAVLHEGTVAFTAQWRAYLGAQLG